MKFCTKFFLIFFLSTKAVFAADAASKRLTIVASINPIYQIILEITENKSNNVLIMNSSSSEHDYQLKKNDVEAVQKADLIFYVSADLEKKFPRLIASQNKQAQSFELVKINNIKLLQLRSDAAKIDPHIWLDPENALKIAEFVTQKISTIDKKNSQQYQKNLARFEKKISATEESIKVQLSKINDRGYVIYHDGYQYFEKYFSLTPLQIMTSGHSRELTVSRLKEFDDLVKHARVKCIFGDKQDEKNTALKLAQNYQIKFSTLDLIGQKDSYFDLLLKISNTMAGCLN